MGINLFAAFDLVIGCPPCVDSSGTNANREDVLSAKGSYMLLFGQVLNRLTNFNIENGAHEPFFFCEMSLQDGKTKSTAPDLLI